MSHVRTARLVLFLALFTLHPAQAVPPARISVDLTRPIGAVSPLLFGQFAEFMFQDVKEGMTAELLHNRGFELGDARLSLPQDWERDPDARNDDDDVRLRWDSTRSYPGHEAGPTDEQELFGSTHSMSIEVKGHPEDRHGLHQARIPIHAGGYQVGFWALSDTWQGQVEPVLEEDRSGGRTYGTSLVTVTRSDAWRHYTCKLSATQADAHGRFTLLFRGVGHLWLDQVSLLPDAAVDGLRPDVLQHVRSLRPAFLRWPGGNVAQDYHWEWAVGPRDERHTWTNLSWGHEPEPSDFGTDEYMAFCRMTGATPILTVNVEGRGATPAEAAAWVEYCNGPVTSPYGARRAANGHPQPYQVHLWEIGNEIWGDWVRAHSDAATYAANLHRYVSAMRAVDPTIRCIGCGDNDLNWDGVVLSQAGHDIDFLAVHHYYGSDDMAGNENNFLSHPLYYEMFYRKLEDLIRQSVPDHPVRLAINEWNTSLPAGREETIESALYAGRMMNVFLRSGGAVAMSAVSDMVNGWLGGVIQASRQDVYMTPTGLVNVLYSQYRGDTTVDTVVSGPTVVAPQIAQPAPVLDAATTITAHQIFVHLVNTGTALPLTVQIKGAAPVQAAVFHFIAGDMRAGNSFSRPQAVHIQTQPVALNFTLPAHSIGVLTINRDTSYFPHGK